MMLTVMMMPSPNELADTLLRKKSSTVRLRKELLPEQEQLPVTLRNTCSKVDLRKQEGSSSLLKMSTTAPKMLEEQSRSPVESPARSPPATASARPRSSSSRFLQNNKPVLLGPLPDDFLRIDSLEKQRQIDEDEQTAIAMFQRQSHPTPLGPPGYTFRTVLSPTVPMPPIVGRLDLMILEAKLVKNYGLTRMDPYVRVRFGMHQVYESQTSVNGGKNPRWDKTFHVFLPEGQESFHLQIMDEKTFSDDEEIAYLHYEIPEDVLKNGKTKEEWIDLQGRQGKEGVLGMVLKFTPITPASALHNAGITTGISPLTQVAPGVTMTPAPVVLTYGSAVPPVYVNRRQGPPVPLPVIPEEDINQLRDMFPSVDVQVIKTLLENERGNKDRVINHLLAMVNN